MADHKAQCGVFQAHKWTKDLCANCLKTRGAHPMIKPQAPTPIPMCSRENTPDNQTSGQVDSIPTQPAGDILVCGVPPGDKADLEDEINCNKPTADCSAGGTDVRESSQQESGHKNTTHKFQSESDSRSNINPSKPAIASKPRPTVTKPKPVQDKQPSLSQTTQSNKSSTSTRKDNNIKKVLKPAVSDSDPKDGTLGDVMEPAPTSAVKPRRRRTSGSRPQAPPPKAPQDKPQTTKPQDQVLDKSGSSNGAQHKVKMQGKAVTDKDRTRKPLQVHIKGLTTKTTNNSRVENVLTEPDVVEAEYSQVAPSDNIVTPSGSGDKGDISESVQVAPSVSGSSRTVVAPSVSGSSRTVVDPSVSGSSRTVVAPSVSGSIRTVVAPSVSGSSRTVVAPSVSVSGSAPVAASSSRPVTSTGGGGHYYHKYDITGSLQRSMKKPVDKRKERVKEDLAFGTKKALVTPYTVVDVTNCRRECEEKIPPQLPSSPPPEHPVSEPNSRENTLKKQVKIAKLDTSSQAGSQNSVHNEPPPSPKLPIILLEEAAKMQAESRTPPPHRKVPILIRPQSTSNSNTYEPIEDYLIEETTVSESVNEAEGLEGQDPERSFGDYAPTDVDCFTFSRQSKERTSNKTQAFETKMAALANLDLLKGIAPKVQPQEIQLTSVEKNEMDVSPSASSPSIIEEQGMQKLSKKTGKSFFKKLLKIGSKDGGVPQRDTSPDVHDLTEPTGSQRDVMSVSAYDEVPGSSEPVGYHRQGSGRDDRVPMFNEVQNVLAKRQCSAPDICRELTTHDVVGQDPNAGPSGSRTVQGSSGQHNHSTSLMRKKKNMNINVQTVSPPDEEKINNIKQAEEMALSLGIDKLSPRHRAVPPVVGEPQPTTSDSTVRTTEPSMSTATSHQSQVTASSEGTYGAHSKTLANRTIEISGPVVISSTLEKRQVKVPISEVHQPETSYPAVPLQVGATVTSPSPAATVSPPPRTKPKPNIPAKFPKKIATNEISTSNTDPSKHSDQTQVVVLPELTIDVDSRESSTDVDGSKYSKDSITSPTSSESSMLSCVLDGEATSPQPISPTGDIPGIHGVRRRSSRSRADMKSGKVSRSMMPAPPPPPPVTVCPGSPTDVLPDHKPGSKRLKRTDISAPILTSPDIMSRSYSAAEEKVKDGPRRMDSISKHSRNKTVSEGIKIDVGLISPHREEAELQFDSLGRRSGKFLNRALPPTPGQSVSVTGQPVIGRGKATPVVTGVKAVSSPRRIQENEYELVSQDGEAEERLRASGSRERPAYEDIDDDVYSDPVELVDKCGDVVDCSTSEESGGGSLKRCKSDDYLEPVSGSVENDKPAPATRVLGKRHTLSRMVRHTGDPHRTVYANTDMSVYQGKPSRTVKDGFIRMGLCNVETLAARAEKILDQFIPEQCVIGADLRWSDFVLKDSVPVLQIRDISFYEARTDKMKPHDCYLMLCKRGISSSVLETPDCGTITPITLFHDKVSSDFFMSKSRPDHYELSSPTSTDIAVLGYSTISDLDTAIQNMDCVFTSDLNEYERRVCFWITQITASLLDVSARCPALDTASCDHVIAVTMPSCAQTFPVLIVPDIICSTSDVHNEPRTASKTDWNRIGRDIIRILFRLLRLDYKDTLPDPALEIPVRTKYSVGLRKFVREILRERCSSHGIVFGKVVIETMLWGPCRDDMKHLITSQDHENAFHIWLELRRHLVINDLAMGCCHNTLDFANMLWFLCSVTAKILMDATRILQQSK